MKMDLESIGRVEEGLRRVHSARPPLEPGVEWQRQVMRDVREAAHGLKVENTVWGFAWSTAVATVLLVAGVAYFGMVPDFEVALMLGGDPSGFAAALACGL